MSRFLTTEALQSALTRAYDVALDGFPGVESVEDLAASYRGSGDSREQAQRLIRWQVFKAGTAGFVTGLGGVLTMSVTVPANLAGILFIQSRMVAAVASLAGLDPRSDQVRTLVFACLAGKSALKLVEGSALVVGEKLAVQTIEKISGKTLIALNQKVGFRLATKFGERGVVNLSKMVPLVGGVLGAGFDSVSTRIAGEAALRVFHGPQG